MRLIVKRFDEILRNNEISEQKRSLTIIVISDFFCNFASGLVSLGKRCEPEPSLSYSEMGVERAEDSVASVADVVDGAVGVGKSFWFVAIVNHNSEKQAAEKLLKMGVVNYLPTQSEIRVWKNGRKSKVDRIVIPSTIFVYCTEQKRKEIVGLPFIFRFMTNKAGSIKDSTNKPLAIISDREIERLRFMLGQSAVPVEITEKPFKTGDKVRVLRGHLAGLEGEVMDLKNAKSELIVALDFFGCARLTIDTVNLEIIK